MPIAFLSPLPPTRSGISVYSEMLLPALATRMKIVAVDEHPLQESLGDVPVISFAEYASRRVEFDRAIYQMGNNPHHEWIYREAMSHPGILVLHDLVLHHLIVEMTLARGLADEYVEILRANHGEIGEAWARGRALGFHDELGNFLLPASREIAQRSRGVIVHNRYAAEQLRAMGVDRPVTIAPMSFETTLDFGQRPAMRERLGFSERSRVIGMFGFVTDSKRPDVVIEAFALAAKDDPDLRLLIVGEPAPNCDLQAKLARHGLDESRVHTSGYVAEDEFDRYLAATDRVVNLRYPTAGETSGALLRIFAAGRPVAVTGMAQFLEFPDQVATRIPLGEGEVEALVAFMTGADDRGRAAAAQRAWLTENCRASDAVSAYVSAMSSDEVHAAVRRELSGIPLFPALRLTAIRQTPGAAGLSATFRNEGAETLRAAVFGVPGYRMIAQLFDREGRKISDRWLALESDLRSGEETTLNLPGDAVHRAGEVRFHHALEGVPSFESQPFEVRTFA